MNKEYKEIALNPKFFKKLGSQKFIDISNLDESDPAIFESIFYKEIPVVNDKMDETLIVTYSPKYKAYQRQISLKQIERAENMINSSGKF